jgi:hypothetical protein
MKKRTPSTRSERAEIWFLQIVAAFAVVLVIVLAAALSVHHPIPASIAGSLASALIAKWFGRPLTRVMLDQVTSLPPPLAAEVARRAIDSLPPAARLHLHDAQIVLSGLTEPPPRRE